LYGTDAVDSAAVLFGAALFGAVLSNAEWCAAPVGDSWVLRAGDTWAPGGTELLQIST
jgi:hypothetical protein